MRQAVGAVAGQLAHLAQPEIGQAEDAEAGEGEEDEDEGQVFEAFHLLGGKADGAQGRGSEGVRLGHQDHGYIHGACAAHIVRRVVQVHGEGGGPHPQHRGAFRGQDVAEGVVGVLFPQAGEKFGFPLVSRSIRHWGSFVFFTVLINSARICCPSASFICG